MTVIWTATLPNAQDMQKLYEEGKLPPGILPPFQNLLPSWQEQNPDTETIPDDTWRYTEKGVYY